MVQFDQFEKLAGGAPYRILDKHPDGRHIVMQAKAHYSGRSAVWEQGTGRIVWRPERAIALAWLRNGTQLGVLRETSETPYELVIYTWPEVQPLYRCPVAPPFGWGEMLDLVISPQNNLALCQWIDQSETGLEFIDITAQAVFQDTQASYFLKGTNDVTRPVFSPTGHYWIFGYKLYEVWWASDPENIDTYDQPAQGGEYRLGAIVVFRGKRPLTQTIPLIATIPSGWIPTDPEAEGVLSLADPSFLDELHVQIHLPSGEVQIHQLPLE